MTLIEILAVAYAALALVTVIGLNVLAAYDRAKNNCGGPRSWIGWIGVELGILGLVAPLWLPIAVLLGIALFFTWLDDLVADARADKKAREHLKAEGRCTECRKNSKHCEYDPQNTSVVSRWRLDELLRLERDVYDGLYKKVK